MDLGHTAFTSDSSSQGGEHTAFTSDSSSQGWGGGES